MKARHYEGEWTHSFGAGPEVKCRILLDAEKQALVAAQALNGTRYEPITGEQFQELSESIIDIHEAHFNPENWGLTECKEWPAWELMYHLSLSLYEFKEAKHFTQNFDHYGIDSDAKFGFVYPGVSYIEGEGVRHHLVIERESYVDESLEKLEAILFEKWYVPNCISEMQIEDALRKVFNHFPEYQVNEDDALDSADPFLKMVEKFAEEDYYPYHEIAKVYLTNRAEEVIYLTNACDEKTWRGSVDLESTDLDKVPFEAGPGLVLPYVVEYKGTAYMLGSLEVYFKDEFWDDGDSGFMSPGEARTYCKTAEKIIQNQMPEGATLLGTEDMVGSLQLRVAIPLNQIQNAEHANALLREAYGVIADFPHLETIAPESISPSVPSEKQLKSPSADSEFQP